MNNKSSICFVLTTEFSVSAFMLTHLRELSKQYDITVITNTNNLNFLSVLGIKVDVLHVPLDRNIRILSDLANLISLIKLFHLEKFSAVHSVTPKAGLLAMFAAWLVRTPMRIHTFTGQVWMTKTGVARALLKHIDKLIAWLTTDNLIDSTSQRDFMISEKVTTLAKSTVFAKGSISGVDIKRFKPNKESKDKVRNDLKLNDEDFLFLFIGRLTTDKGVLDLAEAFSRLAIEHGHLLYVGPDEQGMQQKIMQAQTNESLSNVHFVGHTDSPELYMAAADALCLPSYREGFGTVLIEAAATGIPAIASQIYGITDAVIDNETGLLHPTKDVDAIAKHMKAFTENPALMIKLGRKAKERAVKEFNADLITKAWVKFYQDRLA